MKKGINVFWDWFFGLSFLLSGMIGLFSGEENKTIAGVLIMTLASTIIPPLSKITTPFLSMFIEKVSKGKANYKTKIAVVVSCFLLAGFIILPEDFIEQINADTPLQIAMTLVKEQPLYDININKALEINYMFYINANNVVTKKWDIAKIADKKYIVRYELEVLRGNMPSNFYKWSVDFNITPPKIEPKNGSAMALMKIEKKTLLQMINYNN